MNKEFAKIYNTESGQILITITAYGNGSEISIKFNDENSENEGIHELKLMFRAEDVKSGEARFVFESLSETTAHQLIAKAIENAQGGIVSGVMADIDDMKSVRH